MSASVHWWNYGNATETSCGQPGPATVYPGFNRVTCPECLAELARQNGCTPDALYAQPTNG